MEFLLNRYRNLTVVVVVIAAQLLLLAYQVRTNQDMRLIRVWAVTAVTPLANVLESVRSGTVGFLRNFVVLHDVRDENRHLKEEAGRLKLENQFLKTELATADRVRALAAFQSHTPSRTLAARIIGAATGAGARVVLVDRGSASGVLRGMAVVTPDGIVGKVLAAFPTASQVMLVTDPSFAAGVISQKNRVRGTLKGQGHSVCIVDYVQNEEKVEVGEWFYTSGDDRIFPKGLPAGTVSVARQGKTFKEIFVAPAGFQNGLEEVLIVLEGVHQNIPEIPAASTPLNLLPPPPPETPAQTQDAGPAAALTTDADRLRERYKKIGEAQGHVFGGGPPGGKPPDFNYRPPEAPPPQQPQPPPPSTQPPARP